MTTTPAPTADSSSTTQETPRRRGAVRPSRVRARYAPATGATGRTGAEAFGAVLRQLRVEHGWSASRLADRAGVSRSTVRRFEGGQLRPRPSTVGWLAGAIDPDRRAEIRDRLVAAAGDDLAPHNETWARYQMRRMDRALQEGRAPLPVAMARAIRLTAASGEMLAVAMALTDRAAAALDEPGAGCLVDELMALSDQLQAESDLLWADPGGRLHGPPPRRWRGDPPDVSPNAPPLGDLAAVRRWLRAWRVREGRLEPRSARERAIAVTGSAERQAIADAPDPPPAKMAEDIVSGTAVSERSWLTGRCPPRRRGRCGLGL